MLNNQYLTVADLQTILRCGRSKAYRIAKDPSLPIIHVGRTILIDKEAFEKTWLPNKRATVLR